MLFLRLSFSILFYQGTKDRMVTVLFEGSGDYQENAAPRRDPVYLGKLSNDQIDIIHTSRRIWKKNCVFWGANMRCDNYINRY